MTEALLKWLSTFMPQNASQSEQKSWNDVSDGVAMAKVLHRIDSSHFTSGFHNIYVIILFKPIRMHIITIMIVINPALHFLLDWVSKIRGDIPSDNKRLRANNLKKVANAIEEYNSEVLGIHYNSGFVQPDLTKAAEGNSQDLGKYEHFRLLKRSILILLD